MAAIEELSRVDFTAADDAVAPLTWGQLAIWGPLRSFGTDTTQFNLSRVLPLPGGVDRQRFLRSVRDLMRRCPALRTHFADGAQHVVGTGSIEVTIVVDHADEPVARGETLASGMAAEHFELATQWPVRIGAVGTPAGQIAAVAIVVSHVALDGWALDALLGEYLADLGRIPSGERAAREEPPRSSSRSAIDQLSFERSPVGAKVSSAALARWRAGLAVAPASMFDFAPTATTPRPVEQYVLESTAIPVAAPILGARSGTSVSTVLLTLTMLLLRTYVGHDTIALQLIAGNRFDQRQRALRAPTAQDGLLVMECVDSDLVTATRRVFPEAMSGYLNARYDPTALTSVKEEIGHRRGVHFDLSAYFNDTRAQEWRTNGTAVPDRSTLDQLRAQSVFRKTSDHEWHDMKFYVGVGEVRPGRCRLSMRVNTTWLPVPLGEQVLRSMEKLLCVAVHEEIDTRDLPRLTGIEPVRRGPEWLRTAAGWADRRAVAAVVSEAASGRRVAVFGRPSRGQPMIDELVAFVASPGVAPTHLATPDLAAPGVVPAHMAAASGSADDRAVTALHRRVMQGLPSHVGAVAPDIYVLVSEAPRDVCEVAGWAAAPVLATGAGRPADPSRE